MLPDLLAHQPCKLIVDGVSWTCGYDASLDGFANQSHVADDIEQLMPGTFIVPHKWSVLYISQLCRVNSRYSKLVAQRVNLFLGHLTLIYHDGVIHVSALDKVCLEKRHYVTDKDKGPCSGDFFWIVLHTVKRGEL